MTRRPQRDPEPVLIELVPLDGPATVAGVRPGRPPTAGVGTLPSATAVLSVLITRALDTPDPPLVRAAGAAGAWPDARIHRLVRVPRLDAARSLHAALVACGGLVESAATRRTRGAHRAGVPAGSLEILGPSTSGLAAALHVGHGRATPVEIVLEPWSAHRTDLCLQVRRRPGRTGLHLPRRYFDVAHRVVDVLWHQIEADAAA